ncbi:MAG: glucokinase [Desulfobacteraceae bacterium]|nr:glucokinase [Desulfobacteraceae bacterium]
MILAGDVGGTNTRLAVFSNDTGPKHPLVRETFPSNDYTGLEEIVKQFLSGQDFTITRACFGVAGPVKDGRATITNLPWIIEEKTLSLELGLEETKLLNDLEAIASSIPYLDADDIETINHGDAVHNGTIALVAPGTGLGEAFLTWDGNRYRAHPSEGGHANFAPANQLETDLLEYMGRQYKHVSCERICSGIGIPNIYNFLKETGRFHAPDWLANEIAGAQDPSPVIFKYALDPEKKSAICVAVLEIFISALGNETGNLALKVLADGGVYLGGGIPPKIRESIRHGGFMQAFGNKGRLSTSLSPMPVRIIMYPDASLLGAACRGLSPYLQKGAEIFQEVGD